MCGLIMEYNSPFMVTYDVKGFALPVTAYDFLSSYMFYVRSNLCICLGLGPIKNFVDCVQVA